MTHTCENIKAELGENHQGLTALAQLVAIYTSAGMSSVSEIAERIGYSERAIRKAKAELGCRNPGATGTPVPEPGYHERNPGAETAPECRNPGAALARANKESPSEIVISEKQQQQPERKVVDANELHAKLIKAAGAALNPLSVGLEICAEPLGWINGGADLDLDIIPVVAAISKTTRPGIVNAWKYYRNGVIQARDARLAGLPPPVKPAQSADVLPFKVTTAMNVKPRLDPPMVAAHA